MSKNSGAPPCPGAQTGSIEFNLTAPARGVPIDSALVDLVARRTKGKSGADDLFPEYPVPKRSTSQRERSFRASNEFTEYRRSVGVEEVVPGRRRSLVNFHSFRRYFITKAEQADQMEHIIAVVVGHKRNAIGRAASRRS
jgi:integrase